MTFESTIISMELHSIDRYMNQFSPHGAAEVGGIDSVVELGFEWACR